MYNVRVKKFFDAEQIQVYSQMMQSERNVKFDEETGEIKEHKRKSREPGTIMFNPFTGEYERMVEYDEAEAKAERSVYVSRSRTVHMIYDIARANKWEWFVTLTFNPDKVNRYDYTDCTKKLSQWLKNAKKKSSDMKYIVVPELHKDGAYHFHGLFADCEELGFVDSGVSYSGRPVYNVGSYKLGFTTAMKIDDLSKTCSYLTKYITKELCANTKNKKRYWTSRNVELPEVIDLHVENLTFFRRYFVDGANFVKTVNTEYAAVTYIELEKGASEFITFRD